MRRIWSQCVKEWVQFRRDRLTTSLAFLLPFLSLIIFGFAIRLEAKNIPLVVQDFDHSNLSRAYVERLAATNQFELKPWSEQQPVSEALDQGLAKVGVVIPPDFSRRLRSDKNTAVQVLVDGTDANNARVIQNSIRATTNFFLTSEDLVPQTPPIQAETRTWFNPGRKESLYIVPGVFAVVLWIFPSLLAAIAMVREKEKGTILQVYASSLTATELLVGKGLAYWFVALLEAAIVIGMAMIIFHLWFAGDPTPFLLGTPLFLASAVLFGLFLGVRTSNQNAAVQGVALVGFITALLLSGFIYPISNIPFPLSLLSNVIPARYYIVITRDAFVRGIGWPGTWYAVMMIALIGLFFFAISRKLLSRMQLTD